MTNRRFWPWLFFTSILVYRLLVWTIPFFSAALLEHPLPNILCGLFSDAFLICAFLALSRVKFSRIVPVLGLLWLWGLASHLRYVEHYGMALRPYHMLALGVSDVWSVGPFMVLQSWRCLVLLLASALGAAAFSRRQLPSPRWYWLVAGLLLSNIAAIQLRERVGMHPELRYNPISALYYNIARGRAERSIASKLFTNPEQLLPIRDLLGPGRHYVETPTQGSYPKYPLWQNQLADNEPDASETQLLTFLRQEEARLGPWNVVLVLSESLRAHELTAFGADPQHYGSISPHLTKLAGEGIRFTEVISAGIATHFGQTAAFCSLYAFESESLIIAGPQMHAVCLGDVFNEKSYKNFFFYPAFNQFDNQETFYKNHQVAEVQGEERMDPNSQKGGWGYSDHALFEHALAEVKTVPGPFFATILTLTNHHPHKVPADAPAGVVDANKPLVAYQMLQYVDWAFGAFYERLRQEHPHTIVVLTADHGIYYDNDKIDAEPSYDELRKVARIPILLLIPGLPEALQGQSVSQLASNVDIAPTLLKLLGWEKTAQQFMGRSLFGRTGPVFANIQDRLYQISPDDRRISRLPEGMGPILSSLTRFNTLAPAEKPLSSHP